MVGETGFEPATPCTQNRCATRLRHSPTEKNNLQKQIVVGLIRQQEHPRKRYFRKNYYFNAFSKIG
jgi:hypothetical protein